MKPLKKILFEIYKNFKLIFRNWSSLVLIIIAPLLLILLVGYSLSGDKLHGINVGVVAPDTLDLAEFQRNVTDVAQIIRYNQIDSCLEDMALANAHICLEITGEIKPKEDELPAGEVKFYYDNTRMKMTLPLMTQIKDFFGLTSEKISLISTQTIFDNLQNFVGYLSGRIDDLEESKKEAESIRQDLIERREQLVKVRNDFRPKYLAVKAVQKDVRKYSDSFTNSTDSLIGSLDQLKSAIKVAEQSASIISNPVLPNITLPNASLPNITLPNITIPSIPNITIPRAPKNVTIGNYILNISSSELEGQIDYVKSKTVVTRNEAANVTRTFDDAVKQLDDIDALLEGEIKRTDSYIVKINQSVEKMDAIIAEAREKLKEISRFGSSDAEKIVKPITQEFLQLRSGVKGVQLAFPILLTTVIVFISLLFANIITLLEIYNKAYTRNILAPVNDLLYTAGMALTNFIVIFFQVCILLLVAQFKFNVDIAGHIWQMLPVAIIMIFIFVFIGMIVAYLSNNIQTSILITTFVALAFFLLSDLLNTLEAMPIIAAAVAKLNPVVVANAMFRKIIFFDIPLSALTAELAVLLAYLIATGVLLVCVSKRKNKRRF